MIRIISPVDGKTITYFQGITHVITMPRKKQCLICKGKKSLYPFPKETRFKIRWTQYVETFFPHVKICKTSRLCYLHFKQKDFKNWTEWHERFIMGDTQVKLFKEDYAVPSIVPRENPFDEPVPHVTISEASPTDIPLDQNSPQYGSSSETSESDTNQPSTSRVCSTPHSSSRKRPYEHDTDYDPDESFIEYHDQDLADAEEFDQTTQDYSYVQGKSWTEGKFIIPWSFLLTLLSNCRNCGEKEKTSVVKQVVGAVLNVKVTCGSCNFVYEGCSSPMVEGRRMYQLNYTLSCAILFGGSLATKALRVWKLARIHVIAPRTFFRHQKEYLNMVVKRVSERKQQDHLSYIKQQGYPITIAGDGRCDSMGHSAKYGSYTIMDATHNKIITSTLIQTTGNSNAMEMKGFIETLRQVLVTFALNISSFISDRHIQIRKYMRETHGPNRKDKSQPLINHYIDGWHCAKSLRKDLKNAAKTEGSNGSRIQEWMTAIINHMYWVPTSVDESLPNRADVVEAKWRSLLNHIVNKHKHTDPLYPRCEHPRARKGEKKKKYMSKDSPAYELLTDIVEKRNRIKDVRQLSPHYQTSGLEAFHSVLNHFAPKMFHFHYESMYTRLRLAVIHYNANSDQDKDVPKAMSVIYPKYKKGEASVKAHGSPASFDYVDELFEEAFRFHKQLSTDPRPQPMSEMYRKPDEDRQHLFDTYRTRFPNAST